MNINKRPEPPTQFHYTLALAQCDSIERGVSTTVDVKNLGNESGRSCWVSALVGNIWIQIGYRNNGIYVLEYYFGIPDEWTIINPSAPIFMGEKNTFFIRNKLNTTYWEIGINGIVIAQWNAHTHHCVNAETGIEFYGSNAKFPILNFYPALMVLTHAGWQEAVCGFLSYRGKWGAEGMKQNKSLRKNELNMAGAVPSLPISQLW